MEDINSKFSFLEAKKLLKELMIQKEMCIFQTATVRRGFHILELLERY